MTYPTQQPYRQPPAPPRSGVHPMAWVALGLALALLGTVGWIVLHPHSAKVNVEPVVNGTPLASISAAIAAIPACSALFVPGKVIDDAKALNGCKDKGGGVQILGSRNCAGGKHLWNVDANTGAPAGWGYGGKPYHAVTGDIAADKGYAKAYTACGA